MADFVGVVRTEVVQFVGVVDGTKATGPLPRARLTADLSDTGVFGDRTQFSLTFRRRSEGTSPKGWR